MTDFDRLIVAWDRWGRRSAATASGVGLSPLVVGAVIAAGLVGGVLEMLA